MPADAPRFVRFVRSVEGRACARWGTKELFGARLLKPSVVDRKAGAPTIEWDTERVVPLDEAFCHRYRRELDRAVRDGDLDEVDEAAFKAWLGVQKKREADAAKARAGAKAEADKGTTAPASSPGANEVVT